jgi:hypothetical protein
LWALYPISKSLRESGIEKSMFSERSVTVSAASPVKLVCGARPALLAVLCCSGLCGCLGDTEDLFPAMSSSAVPAADSLGVPSPPVETPADSPPPADGSAWEDGTAVDGETAPEPPSAAGASSDPEQPNPIGLDPTSAGAPSEGSAPAGGEPPSDDAAQPPPEPPVEAPAPPLDEPPPAGDATGIAELCAGVADPLLLDFASPGDDPTQALFGDFREVLSGGTYVYPNADEIEQQVATGLRSDVTAGDWHISGSVTQQAGFGLFLDCQLLDASRFTGLAFRVSGDMEGADSITLLIGTAENDVSSAWLVENDVSRPPSSGRCTPAQNEYDGTCNQARIEIPISRQTREVLVPFAALAQGSPEPGVNPAEITTIAWALPSPGVNRFGNTTAYDVDLRIDDIRFIDSPAPPSPAAPAPPAALAN